MGLRHALVVRVPKSNNYKKNTCNNDNVKTHDIIYIYIILYNRIRCYSRALSRRFARALARIVRCTFPAEKCHSNGIRQSQLRRLHPARAYSRCMCCTCLRVVNNKRPGIGEPFIWNASFTRPEVTGPARVTAHKFVNARIFNAGSARAAMLI